MSWLSRIVRRARYLIRHRGAELEMAEEMRFHVEMETDALIQQGVPHDEARRLALVAFGGVERFKEAGRDARGVRLIEDIAHDIRYAVRTLWRTPGVTIAAVCTLALGIAATTAVVSAVNMLFLRPLPVHDPDRLVLVHEVWRNGFTATDMGEWTYPYARYLAYRDGTNQVFTEAAGFHYAAFSVRTGSAARMRSGVVASENYFRVLGIQPALGRFFSSGDELGLRSTSAAESTAPEVVISYDFWQREFAGEPSVLGRTLYIDSRPLTIVGVAPKGFDGTMTGVLSDLWVPAAVYRLPPLVTNPTATTKTREIRLTIFGRLRPGISRDQARAALLTIAPHISARDARPPTITDVKLDPMTSIPAMARGSAAGFMLMLSVTAALVLLIAITNVTGMLLARAMYRRREIAVRLALGAGRGRLLRQLVTEGLVLCLAGAIAGVLIANWMIGLVPAVQPPIPVRVGLDLSIDPRVLAIVLAVTVVTGVIAGLVPALQSTRHDLNSALHGVSDAQLPSRHRLRAGFVVAQLAMSLVLLVTAGLFVRALQRGLAIDPGFDPAGVVEAGLDLAPHGYDSTRARLFYGQLLDHVRARPEIASAALGQWTPLSGSYNGAGVLLPGEPAQGGRRLDFLLALVSAGYFQALHVPVVEGRGFTTADTRGAPPVVIVNEEFAKRFWPNESPIGQTISMFSSRAPALRVVGVVRNGGTARGLDDGGHAWVYLPFAQGVQPAMTIYARARGDVSPALAAIRQEVAALNPNIALIQPRTVSSQLAVYLLPQRLAAWLIGAFGLVGLTLASMGIYGVLAYHVAQRTREFGIRLALGARGSDIVRDVLMYALKIVVAAALVGLAVALAIDHLAHAFLFGVGAVDPVTLILVPPSLCAVALVASYIPARRAAKVDPMISLRAE